MNSTHIHHHLWPYALRGSITLVIEDTTIENFEQIIYRNLRQSIAKIIRTFCLNFQSKCLSENIDAIRADHVIIQSYEEQLDIRRLYVAVFIKDPYRQDIALTNDQFLLALKRNQQQLYDDIKHHINLPSTFFEHTSLDPIWLYGVCLLALLVLVVVILMLITILTKRTTKTTTNEEKFPTKTIEQKLKLKNVADRRLITTPIRLAIEEDESNSSSVYNETETFQTSDSTIAVNPPLPLSPYYPPRTSYFHSAIETAIKQHLHDDEPIPFIDDNISVTHSRKSSACWSDRTSLSSRYGLAWKLNLMRSNTKQRSLTPSSGTTKRFQYRTMRYTLPSSIQQFRVDDHL